MTTLTPSTSIDDLYMVGENYAYHLKNSLGIHSVKDLLYHFPFRYDDLSARKQIADLTMGEMVTLQGQILKIDNVYTRYGKVMQKAVFSDGTNILNITWFNQPYLTKTFTPGIWVNLAGKVQQAGIKPTLTSPQYEILRSGGPTPMPTLHTGRLVPVYPETTGVSSKWLRSRIKSLLPLVTELIEEWLPENIIQKFTLINLPTAIEQIHFPQNQIKLGLARKRLAFDEMLQLQLQSLIRKKEWTAQPLRHELTIVKKDLEVFIKNLPFKLTTDQQTAIENVIQDLNQKVPMNRLLAGDVGSGKTVVAAAAIYAVIKKGLKAAFMVPTEVLADQHLATLEKLLSGQKIRIGFFTGSKKSKTATEDCDLYLGTHSLLFQNLLNQPIALVVIDEQHRFGVEQRAKLVAGHKTPHLLTMTATPIPRTVALTAYGDLALSQIKQLPKGRKKIKTWVVPSRKRKDAYAWIAKQIANHQSQAYIIYPLIDPSDKLAMSNVKAAQAEFKNIQQVFKDFKVGLIHGRLKAKEKEGTMSKFRQGKLDILVATSVIEVGIDVRNATIMVIEGAERFGLAQLHQLRGRIGRGLKQSYCLIFTSNQDRPASKRLKNLELIFSGAELAELDLKLRGPGELFGTQQSGYVELKLASFNDLPLINDCRQAAEGIMARPLTESLKKRLKNLTIRQVKPN